MAWMNISWYFDKDELVIEEFNSLGEIENRWYIDKPSNQAAILDDLQLTVRQAKEQKQGKGKVSSLWFHER